jgi:hypothetical protein
LRASRASESSISFISSHFLGCRPPATLVYHQQQNREGGLVKKPAYVIANPSVYAKHKDSIFVVWTDFWGCECSVYSVPSGDILAAWREAFQTAISHGWTRPRPWQWWRRQDTVPPPGVDISDLKPSAVDPLSLHSWKRGAPSRTS